MAGFTGMLSGFMYFHSVYKQLSVFRGHLPMAFPCAK
jgi:hypothetical protein